MIIANTSNKFKWSPYFAWRPVKTINHEWIWLEWAERIKFRAPEIEPYAPFSFFGGWCFRRTTHTTPTVT